MLRYNTAYFAHHERIVDVLEVPRDDKFNIVYCRHSNMNCIFRAFFRNSLFPDKRLCQLLRLSICVKNRKVTDFPKPTLHLPCIATRCFDDNSV